MVAIDHLDATIRVFDPDADLDEIKPKLPPRHSAFRGEVTRLVLTALRKSDKPLPVSEITLHVATGRGLGDEDKVFLRVLAKRVGACLRNLKKKGLVRMTREIGHVGLWEIVR